MRCNLFHSFLPYLHPILSFLSTKSTSYFMFLGHTVFLLDLWICYRSSLYIIQYLTNQFVKVVVKAFLLGWVKLVVCSHSTQNWLHLSFKYSLKVGWAFVSNCTNQNIGKQDAKYCKILTVTVINLNLQNKYKHKQIWN